MNDMQANDMKINKTMLGIIALIVAVLIGIFAFNIYNDTKVVKINSADIVITEKPGIREDEKIITVDAGERAIFYSFDGGDTYQTDNTYTVTGNKNLHIVLKDSDRRIIGEKDYKVGFAIDVIGVSLNKTEIKLSIDNTDTLIATINPTNATNQRIVWTSSNTSVATVERGKVTAKGKGTAIITATTYNGKKATCNVTVTSPVAITGINLDKSVLELYVGKSDTLNATISPSDATDQSVTWSSSDTDIVTVSHGKVTAKKKGTAIITATTNNGKKATCKVIDSNIEVAGVDLNKTELKIAIGQSETLTASINPNDATDKTVTWTSSDTSVATVEKGKVTAKKLGTATITVTTHNGRKATCKVTVTNPITVTGVSLNKTELKLYVGKSDTLTATVSPADATDKTVTWSSSDKDIATVEKGKVTAKKAGTVTITATTHNGKKATCKVTVSNIAVTGISLNKTELKLYTGQSETLTATISPVDATNKTVTWTSSDTSVATVEKGKGTAKKAGTVTITAKSNNGKTATCKVTITANVVVTGISLNKTSTTIVVGNSETLTATISPSNATNKTITWTSSDTSIATVSNGKITAKKAGTATITAKSNNGKTATCKVTVSNVAVTGISLNKTSTTLVVGQSETLTATISPSNATNKTVTWSSSDTSVATVSNGKVTAKKTGTATITAKSNNGKTATCKVTVSNVAVTGISLNKTSTTLVVGQSETLTATISPSNATNKTVTWSSSNTNIATVSNGKITAKSAGTATITAKSNNGKTATCKVTVLTTQKLIDFTNMSFRTYMKQVYSGDLARGNYQNFGFTNFRENGETLFITNKYTGNNSAEQVRLKIIDTKNVKKWDHTVYNNVVNDTTVTYLSSYYSHGQGFHIALSPSGNEYLMFFTAATSAGGTQYLRVFKLDGGKNPVWWKDYPDLKGQASVDRENDIIAMINGTTCKVYKYSDLINNNKITKLYEFSFTRTTTSGGQKYVNGFATKDGYLYEIRGACVVSEGYCGNGIEAWDYTGAKALYKKLSIMGNDHEPQGIHIYNGTIYIGVTEIDMNNPNWTYTIGYLQ